MIDTAFHKGFSRRRVIKGITVGRTVQERSRWQTVPSRFSVKRIAFLFCIVLIAAATIFVPPAIAVPSSDLANGAQVFQAHCEGCHLNGGNIIRRGKTLKINALKRNGMDSPEAIAQIVTNGKNNMSAFRDRLTEQQIQDVTAYVLDRAEADWKKPGK